MYALSGNTYSLCATARSSTRLESLSKWKKKTTVHRLQMRVSASAEEDDCNTEECAPDKEIGTVSMEWLAGEKTRVTGTFPPRNRGWTGYVEKDTAGQTNIYSVEPAVYVAESAISSGAAGSSSEGSEQTATVVTGIALVSVAAASTVLLLVGKNPAVVQTPEYSGPSLTYYINKFKPVEVIEAAAPAQVDENLTMEESSAQQVLQIQPQVQEQQLEQDVDITIGL